MQTVAEAFGYSAEELRSIPAEANMGLSCGNPVATAHLRPGEVVVDLGSGGGIDVLLATKKVGPEGRAIGIIACAAGWQAASSTLQAMRAIVHALRGWPTPLGVAINTMGNVFDADGAATDKAVAGQLKILADQVVEFARMRELSRSSRPVGPNQERT